jgi:hypothetical protein
MIEFQTHFIEFGRLVLILPKLIPLTFPVICSISDGLSARQLWMALIAWSQIPLI